MDKWFCVSLRCRIKHYKFWSKPFILTCKKPNQAVHNIWELNFTLLPSQVIADKSFLGFFKNRRVQAYSHTKPLKACCKLVLFTSTSNPFLWETVGQTLLWALSQENSIIRGCSCLGLEVLMFSPPPYVNAQLPALWCFVCWLSISWAQALFNKIVCGHKIV